MNVEIYYIGMMHQVV